MWGALVKKNNNVITLACTLIGLQPFSSYGESEYFIEPFGGYSFATSDFKAQNTQNKNQSKLKVNETGHYGLILGTQTPDPGNIYLLYSHLDTKITNSNTTDISVNSLNIDYFHLGGSLYYPHENWNNIVTVSLGLTQFRPNNQLNTETRFSMGFGVGAEYSITRFLAFTAGIRSYATIVEANNNFLCDANQCIWQINSDLFWQTQANLGVKFIF